MHSKQAKCSDLVEDVALVARNNQVELEISKTPEGARHSKVCEDPLLAREVPDGAADSHTEDDVDEQHPDVHLRQGYGALEAKHAQVQDPPQGAVPCTIAHSTRQT